MVDVKGSRTWIFPDGELPPKGDYELKGHESVIILNLNDEEAVVKLDLYFTDREPFEGIEIKVAPKRVRGIRLDNSNDLMGYEIPEEIQYAMRMESNVPVVMQYGRLDTRDQPMAFYINQGFNN